MFSIQSKVSRSVKNQENVIYNQEKKQSIKTDWGIIKVIIWAHKDAKIAVIAMFKYFRKTWI